MQNVCPGTKCAQALYFGRGTLSKSSAARNARTRNVQGLGFHPLSGRPSISEHGPTGSPRCRRHRRDPVDGAIQIIGYQH